MLFFYQTRGNRLRKGYSNSQVQNKPTAPWHKKEMKKKDEHKFTKQNI